MKIRFRSRLHIVEGMWDLAALRFDSPVGQPWTVCHVEPRFYSVEEVFQTMAHDNRTFIMVDWKVIPRVLI